MTPPRFVLDELARRQSEAEKAFEAVVEAAALFGMNREEYCQFYMERFPPITWVSSTTGGRK